ncbi:unnamed protein product [Ectocarpus sp. 12 AP-2014]
MDAQRKELALAPFSKAYYDAVRSGLCNDYLAASVIDSDWASSSKTGGMGKLAAAEESESVDSRDLHCCLRLQSTRIALCRSFEALMFRAAFQAGAALELMSSAVPVVGGLPEPAGKALETGDHYLHTRRFVKITALARDAMESCPLARTLALHLTDGLKADTKMMDDKAYQFL